MPELQEIEIMKMSDRQNDYSDSRKEAFRTGTVLVVETILNSDVNGNEERIHKRSIQDIIGFSANDKNEWVARFDAVVCDSFDDVIETKEFLNAIDDCLKPEGNLFLKIQNTKHRSLVEELLAGSWRRNPSRRNARRYYTRKEIEKLLFRSGFEISKFQNDNSEEVQDRQSSEKPIFSHIGRLQVGTLTSNDVDDFHAKCFSIVATKRVETKRPLTSIIVLTHNQVAYTRMCIDSIRRYTDEPYELIVVDNASTDSTNSYLNSLQNVKTIFNNSNRGFPAAVNQGIEIATGEYILLLNNDTIVTTGWLPRMQDAMQRDSQVGLVGPCSNNVSGSQQVLCEIDDLACLDGFAWQQSQIHARESRDTERLVGFCLLIKRETLEKIGHLDERFGIGCFEDDDFCRRAIQAGYRAVIADDSFVYHFGSVTFRNSNVDFGGLMQENQKKYDQKWKNEPFANGEEKDSPTRINWNVIASDTGALLLEKKTCNLSLCMIVRDNEKTIEPCLKSIRPWVDEIIVVDTGSQDRTPEICEEYGARLFRFPWCDDFSRARNESLKYATGEWLFWMDSDDTIPAECGRKLKELAEGNHDPNIMGYVMQVHCPGNDSDSEKSDSEKSDSEKSDSEKDVTIVDHVKMFRSLESLRFEHRIHEQIIPAIRRAGGDVAFTDIYVVHSGSDRTPEGRRRKLKRDYQLLELDLAERPDHPFVLFNLGMTLADDEQHDEAIRYLQRCISVSQPNESHLRKAFALLIGSLSQVNKEHEAWQSCVQGLNLYPDDKELLFRAAMLHHHFGRYRDAERAYLRVIGENEDRHFSSIDAELAGYKSHHNLALVYEDMGKTVLAEKHWRRAIKEHPHSRGDWRGLGECLMKQKKKSEIKDFIGDLKTIKNLASVGSILEARLLEDEGAFEEAGEILGRAAKVLPNDIDVQNELCRILFYRGTAENTENALRKLIELDPEDAAAWHNLGVIYSREGKNPLAKEAFETSLRYRPNSETTRLELTNIVVGHAVHGNQ